MTAPDIFALGGRENDPDAELFAAMAAYNRLIDAANNAHDEDETGRFCEEAQPHRDRVEQYRPATIRGVLAALDFGSEIDDPHYWPEGAIEGLRALTHRKG